MIRKSAWRWLPYVTWSAVAALSWALATTTACGPSAAAQAQATQAKVALAANGAIALAIQIYRSEGLSCVERSQTRPEYTACAKDVDAAWAPVWASWAALRAANDAATDPKAAWCAFAASFPQGASLQGLVEPLEGVGCPQNTKNAVSDGGK